MKVLEIKLRAFLASGFWGLALFFGFFENLCESLGDRVSGLPVFKL